MGEALNVNTTLKTLNLGCANQCQNGFFIQEIMNSKNCTDNRIHAQGMAVLSEALNVNTTLTALDLGCIQA